MQLRALPQNMQMTNSARFSFDNNPTGKLLRKFIFNKSASCVTFASRILFFSLPLECIPHVESLIFTQMLLPVSIADGKRAHIFFFSQRCFCDDARRWFDGNLLRIPEQKILSHENIFNAPHTIAGYVCTEWCCRFIPERQPRERRYRASDWRVMLLEKYFIAFGLANRNDKSHNCASLACNYWQLVFCLRRMTLVHTLSRNTDLQSIGALSISFFCSHGAKKWTKTHRMNCSGKM